MMTMMMTLWMSVILKNKMVSFCSVVPCVANCSIVPNGTEHVERFHI